MNRWINNQLKGLENSVEFPSNQGRTERLTFITEVLDRTFSIDDLDPADADCVICQFSLYPTEGEPWPTEEPVRLPCDHFIGQACARKWFGSLVKGKHHVDEDFNTGCPICRYQMFDVQDSQDLKDDNRARWTRIANDLRMQIIQYRTELPYEKVMRQIEARGGFKKILERLDRLALMRWYVFRHFEHNLCKKLNIHLIKTWILRTQTGRPSRNWMTELHNRNPDAAKELNKRLSKAYRVPEPSKHVDSPSDDPEDRILKTFTHADMLPSKIWVRILDAYKGPGWFSMFEMEKIKLELLDTVTWAIRQGEPSEDFAGATPTLGSASAAAST
jgi:hypothetical protein